LQLWYQIVGFDEIYHTVSKTKKRSCDLLQCWRRHVNKFKLSHSTTITWSHKCITACYESTVLLV